MEATGTTYTPAAGNAAHRESSRFAPPRNGLSPDALVDTTLLLPRSIDAPRLARKCVQRQSREQLARSEREIVEILMSELIANAVVHPPPEACGSVDVHFTVTPDRIRVAVRDRGEGFRDVDLNRSRSEPGGYGLVMVDRGSSRWGTTRGDGNCVWFELDRANGTA